MEGKVKFSGKDWLENGVGMLLFYRRHPVLAVRDIFGIKLSTHQRIAFIIIWLRCPRLILLMGRGMSKTFLLALNAVLKCILYPGERITIIGANGLRQGKFVMEDAERIVSGTLKSQERLGFAYAALKKRTSPNVIIKDPDVWKIEWKNGSILRAFPLGSTGDPSRGARSTETDVDEAKDLEEDKENKVLKPMGYVSTDPVGDEDQESSPLVKSGTVGAEGEYYSRQIVEFEKRMQAGDKGYGIVKFTYLDSYKIGKDGRRKHWSIPYRMKISDIERDRDDGLMSYDFWAAENLCIPIRSAGSFYSYNLIKKAYEHQVNPDTDSYLEPLFETNDPVIIGADIATESDFAAFVAIRLGPLAKGEWDWRRQEGRTPFCNVINVWQASGIAYGIINEKIREWLKIYPNTLKIAMDAKGGGYGVRDNFAFDGIEPMLYDPADEKIINAIDVSKGSPILKLMSPGDEDNQKMNNFMKGQFEKDKLFIPKYFSRHENPATEEVYKYLRFLFDQLISIRTRPTKKFSSFYVPGKQKKDIYSALLYGMSEVEPLIYLNQQEDEVCNEVILMNIRRG